MKLGLKKVITMSKPLSTYERKMKDSKFRKAYQESYKELLFSELIISLMQEDETSVRKLANEAHISASVIQDLRSGKQHDIKLSNLIKIAHIFGYEIILQKGDKQMTLQEGHQSTQKHAGLVAVAS